MKTTIVGAGDVGGQLAFALALNKQKEIALIDKKEGLAQAKALDIMQSEPMWGFPGRIKGSSDYEIMDGSSVVVIAAGSPRKSGMSREDLYNVNFRIMEHVCDRIKEYAPGAVVIVITNPVDIMSYAVWKLTGFQPSRVMGMGGMLDSARYHYFISRYTSCAPDEAEGTVLGPHSQEMVPLSKASAAGKPLNEAVGKKAALRIKEQTRNGGQQIVSLLKNGSARFAPASCTARMIDAIANDTGETMPASVMASGVWDLPEVYIGLEVMLGRGGVKKVLESDICDSDLELIRKAAGKLRARIDELRLSELA